MSQSIKNSVAVIDKCIALCYVYARMDILSVVFSVSGVKTSVLLPPSVALIISLFTSMAGVSGAFILLPFQMSVLGFTSPAVSATNFVYNIVAIPSGVYRYFKEGRMFWPLAWIISAGTAPGILLGYYIRVLYLPDPKAFKLFVGIVLLYIGARLIKESRGRNRPGQNITNLPADARVNTTVSTLGIVEYEFLGERYRFSVPAMFLLVCIVGIISGTYGIGGGALISTFCVAVFHLPVYTIAGAALLGTFLTSLIGVFVYSVLPSSPGITTSPDWALGLLFGAGGFAGMYIGARLQKFVPQKAIKLMLGLMILSLALRYITQYFL